MLDDFTHPAGKLSIRQCLQYIQVHIDQPRHMKCSYHVFVCVKINTGLSPDTGIHLREQCCRDLNKSDASQIGSRSKSGQITDHSTAQCHQHIFSVKFFQDQMLIEIPDRI